MAATASRPTRLRHALDVAMRTLAALVAGYACAHTFAAFMTVVLPFARPDRVVAGTLLSFVVWTLVALHAFAAASPWRAWWLPAVAFALMMAVVFAFPDAGLRP
ncbi:DUF3649 domain-containing protein [Lysobacter korlensis]|uniref:DUF3649 domain-containing protein n=1 Tax=Lysobacter korlensis TaxID=553636 RepID=A0ABV6RS84_9GAMM